MYGLDAINANNGWAIAAVGITIVFTGLVTLSLVISQLYKVLGAWEDPSKIKAFFKAKQPEEQIKTDVPDHMFFSATQKEAAQQFSLLVRTMDDHFSLSRLLYLSQISGLKDPHSNLNMLLKTKIITPDGTGFFTWNRDRFAKIIQAGS